LKKILIVGGGIGGMCSAVQLAKAGLDVTLVDIDPNWRVYGTGITITGPTFRALREIGVMEQVIASGFPGRGSRARTQSGILLKEVINVGLDPGVPDGGGILRPALHQILSDKTAAMGVRVKLGLTVERMSSNPREAVVGFSDRSEEHFDLVVGADGINSKVRSLAFPGTPAPRFTGQGAWRVLAPRPPEVDMIEMYLGGTVKAGVTPVSQNQLYMFTLSRETAGEFIAPAAQPGRLREVLTGFGGLIGEIRDSLNADSPIVYRPLQIVLLPPPWHRGRVVLVGDAVHATTPHLASGAGCAVEDALVLAQEITRHSVLEDALAAYTHRRFERCRDVVETSAKLGEMELAGAAGDQQARVYSEAMMRLTAPI
jgi:2-polyprenyl-6-methoxyphenol hydroxylase-like FAD-dependent oxidoreductase